MATIDELKELMLGIGIDADTVNAVDPLDWPIFIIAVEKRYAIVISDSDSLKLKTLNDFIHLLNENI